MKWREAVRELVHMPDGFLDSDILLMNEPFGALDTSTRIKMQDLLLKI